MFVVIMRNVLIMKKEVLVYEGKVMKEIKMKLM
jgi:hypothetical protein